MLRFRWVRNRKSYRGTAAVEALKTRSRSGLRSGLGSRLCCRRLRGEWSGISGGGSGGDRGDNDRDNDDNRNIGYDGRDGDNGGGGRKVSGNVNVVSAYLGMRRRGKRSIPIPASLIPLS